MNVCMCGTEYKHHKHTHKLHTYIIYSYILYSLLYVEFQLFGSVRGDVKMCMTVFLEEVRAFF